VRAKKSKFVTAKLGIRMLTSDEGVRIWNRRRFGSLRERAARFGAVGLHVPVNQPPALV